MVIHRRLYQRLYVVEREGKYANLRDDLKRSLPSSSPSSKIAALFAKLFVLICTSRALPANNQ
jgi:hypothetical protein